MHPLPLPIIPVRRPDRGRLKVMKARQDVVNYKDALCSDGSHSKRRHWLPNLQTIDL